MSVRDLLEGFLIGQYSPVYWKQEKAYAVWIWFDMPYLGDESPNLVMEHDDREKLFELVKQLGHPLFQIWDRDSEEMGEQWVYIEAEEEWHNAGKG